MHAPRVLLYARFVLGATIALPFAAFVAAFAHAYYNANEICLERILHAPQGQGEEEKAECHGRQTELKQLSRIFESKPTHITTVTGQNESGKTRLLGAALSGRPRVAVNFTAQGVTSASDFVRQFSSSLDIRYLGIRGGLVELLPFAGSEILVLKERLSTDDFKSALRIATDALRLNATRNPDQVHRPVILLDGLGEYNSDWHSSKEGMELLNALFSWCVLVTKEENLAHVVLSTTKVFAMTEIDKFREARGNFRVVPLGNLSDEGARDMIHAILPNADDESIDLMVDRLGGHIASIVAVCNDVTRGLVASVKDGIDTIENATRGQVLTALLGETEGGTGTSEGEMEGETGTSEDQEFLELDPLKEKYSTIRHQLKQRSTAGQYALVKNWRPLQLWKAIQLIVGRRGGDDGVTWEEMKEAAFDGDEQALKSLLDHDILDLDVSSGTGGARGATTAEAFVIPNSKLVMDCFVDLVEKENDRVVGTKSISGVMHDSAACEARRRRDAMMAGRIAALTRQQNLHARHWRDFERLVILNESRRGERTPRQQENMAAHINRLEEQLLREGAQFEVAQRALWFSHRATLVEFDEQDETNSSSQRAMLHKLLRRKTNNGDALYEDAWRLQQEFEKIDRDGDEKVSARELQHALSNLGHHYSEEEIGQTMRQFDVDGDGKITVDEFIEMVRSRLAES